jgi:hypothetical protein
MTPSKPLQVKLGIAPPVANCGDWIGRIPWPGELNKSCHSLQVREMAQRGHATWRSSSCQLYNAQRYYPVGHKPMLG